VDISGKLVALLVQQALSTASLSSCAIIADCALVVARVLLGCILERPIGALQFSATLRMPCLSDMVHGGDAASVADLLVYDVLFTALVVKDLDTAGWLLLKMGASKGERGGGGRCLPAQLCDAGFMAAVAFHLCSWHQLPYPWSIKCRWLKGFQRFPEWLLQLMLTGRAAAAPLPAGPAVRVVVTEPAISHANTVYCVASG
jgi:hypothetical protein